MSFECMRRDDVNWVRRFALATVFFIIPRSLRSIDSAPGLVLILAFMPRVPSKPRARVFARLVAVQREAEGPGPGAHVHAQAQARQMSRALPRRANLSTTEVYMHLISEVEEDAIRRLREDEADE